MLKWIRLCLIIFMGFSLSGCSKPLKDSSQSKILRLSSIGDPPTLDPRKSADTISSSMIKFYLDGLIRLGSNGQAIFSLAESVETFDEGKRLVFKLKNTTWTDGTPLTAYHFEETWKTNLSPDFPCMLAYLMYSIHNAKEAKEGKVSLHDIGVKALDDTTLEVILKYPDPYFLQLLSSSCFFPYPEYIAEKNLKLIKEDRFPLIGCGAFNLTQWKNQDFLHFKKNPLYHDYQNIQLEEVDILILLDTSTTLSLYEDDQLDWCGPPLSMLPQDATQALKDRKDFYKAETTGLYFYTFNTQVFPLTNANIRKALTLAIDREDIISHILQTNNPPAYGVVPPILDPKTRSYFKDADIDKAKHYLEKGLKELNLTKESFPPLTIYFNLDVPGHGRIAQAIQQQWKNALSLDIELSSKEWKVFLDELNKGQFQISRMGLKSETLDPFFMLNIFAFEQATLDRSGWFSPKYASLIEEAKNSTHLEQRKKLLVDAESILMDAMPIAPIYFYNICYLKKPYLHNVSVDALGNADFNYANLTTNGS